MPLPFAAAPAAGVAARGVTIAAVSAAAPAGGAAAREVTIASISAAFVSTALLALVWGHRSGRIAVLGRTAALAARGLRLPAWVALPAALATASLLVALVGMYWDISLHIDNGRDPGPLANPAHYLILAGLYGIFAAGVFAIALPAGRDAGRSAVRILDGWYAPVGGLLLAACGAFALIGFPLDDLWHRLFGQDVTLWGPTHLMLFGGAGLSLIGLLLLLAEGARGRGRSTASSVRRVSALGGLLIGLSTVQGEFDFGVPQFRGVFQPLLIAFAAGFALVAARLWAGRGGALGAAVFFLLVRGAVSLVVGPVLGEATPALPLYVVEALAIEALALRATDPAPLPFAAASGVLVGTLGLAAEWAWSQVVMPLPWRADLLPEALALAVAGGVAGATLGALLAGGLRGALPRHAPAAALLALVALVACVADGLITSVPGNARATVAFTRAGPGAVGASVRFSPPVLGDEAAWVTATAWQGGGLHVDRLRRVGPGRYETTRPVPTHGGWKSLIRVHRGRAVAGTPIAFPADPAIPVGAIPPRDGERRLVPDWTLLQRERRTDVPGWLWSGACLTVLALFLALFGALAWGVARVARRDAGQAEPRRLTRNRRPVFRAHTSREDPLALEG